MTLQTEFKEQIEKIISNKKLSHAYLIETNNLINYKEYVFYFIKKIIESQLSEDDNFEEICNQIDNGNFINLKIIESDTSIKKEQLITLKRDLTKKSYLNYPEIYIIDDASKLTLATANSLLKFLEEPEDNIIAILVTSNRYNIMETIRSRTQILELLNNEIIELNDEIKEIIKLLEDRKNIVNYNKILEFIPDKIKASEVLKQIEEYYYQKININYEEKYIKYVLIIEDELAKLEYNVNYKLWLDGLLVRFMEVVK